MISSPSEGFEIRSVRNKEDLLRKHRCLSAAFNVGDRFAGKRTMMLLILLGYVGTIFLLLFILILIAKL